MVSITFDIPFMEFLMSQMYIERLPSFCFSVCLSVSMCHPVQVCFSEIVYVFMYLRKIRSHSQVFSGTMTLEDLS